MGTRHEQINECNDQIRHWSEKRERMLKEFNLPSLEITVWVNGGWWTVNRRPRGKGTGKLGGTYIRIGK